ncbi:DUF1800 domain-containing protein [Paracoccus albicereus]|nr:DUF1800 domain-containing protein [Paracoccus albicereus]
MAIDFPELAAIRLGYGLSPNQPPPADAAAVLASVPRAQSMAMPTTMADYRRDFERWQVIRKAQEKADTAPNRAAFQRIRQGMAQKPEIDLMRRIARAAIDPAGFGERLVQFWADHFTVRSKNFVSHVLVSAFVDEAIRPNLSGSFADMLKAATTHPAMLLYLDHNGSTGPNSVFARRRPERRLGLNENLARELVELHTLGVGADYSQTDVRELAELMTGMGFQPTGDRIYRPDRAEPGAEQLLGRSYGGRGTDGMGEIRRMLDDLARHPATASHLSRKLAVHFLSDDPSPDAVAVLETAWRDSDGNLPTIYRALVEHPELEATFRQKARQPFDFIVAAVRALGLDPLRVQRMEQKPRRRDFVNPMRRMGQAWQQPVGPDGWAERADDWISPQGLAARIDWALDLPGRFLDPLPDPRILLKQALGSTVSPALAAAVPRAESEAEGIALILASADFNRR